MPTRSHRADLVMVIVLVVILVGGLALLVSSGNLGTGYERQVAVRSTRNDEQDGASALYDLFERLDVRADRLSRPATRPALDGIDVLFLLDPLYGLAGDERRATADWIEAGGILVASDAYRQGLARLVDLDVEHRGVDWDEPERRTHVPPDGRRLPLARDVESLRFTGRAVIEPPAPSDAVIEEESDEAAPTSPPAREPEADPGSDPTPSGAAVRWRRLLVDGCGLRIAEQRIGRGRVILLAESSFLSNGLVAREDNAVAAMNLVEYAVDRAPGDRVAFDEYHFGLHEQGRSATGILLGLLFGAPAGWAVLVLMAAGVLYLLYRGRRFGTRRPYERPRRRSKLEYVESVGETLRAAGADGLMFALIYRWFKGRTLARLGLGPAVTPTEAAAALARRLGGRRERYRQLLIACEAAAGSANVSPRDASRLIDHLSQLETELADGH